ncbi:MAG: 30S ribosomal protein S3 [Sedimentisphaerales bacterium]|nr:30S ribosomal protein S3 [Sedimentisphaerales bacterium]MBN2843439.1 30S ribosomal protein S3 [Sedimentisphaerales bacterium]
MGQKVSPIGFRTGITLGWQSRWFAPKQAYGTCLVEDQKIRKFLDDRLNRSQPYGALAKVEIERTRDDVRLTLHTSRPGIVIGPKGAEIEKLREAVEDLINRKVTLNVVEIKNPELNAQLIGEGIAEQLKRRAAFRRVMKQSCETAMASGAKGVKIICSGRLGGAELARSEAQILGSIPLQTLDANVDYALSLARCTYGIIGIKVWVYLGKFGEEIQPKAPANRGRGRRGN